MSKISVTATSTQHHKSSEKLKRVLSFTALGKKKRDSKVNGNIYTSCYSALNFIVNKTFICYEKKKNECKKEQQK